MGEQANPSWTIYSTYDVFRKQSQEKFTSVCAPVKSRPMRAGDTISVLQKMNKSSSWCVCECMCEPFMRKEVQKEKTEW